MDFTAPACAVGAWVVLFAGLLRWRFFESMDAKSNNWGLFQWSSNFYREGGALMDFWNAFPHALNLAPTATVHFGLYLAEATGNPYWTFLTFFVGFGAVPLADLVIGEDSYNPTKPEEKKMRQNIWFRIHTIVYVWAYVNCNVLVAGMPLALARRSSCILCDFALFVIGLVFFVLLPSTVEQSYLGNNIGPSWDRPTLISCSNS